jgi:hypothetical protein
MALLCLSDENFLVKFETDARYDPEQALNCYYQVLSGYVVQSRDYIALHIADRFQSNRAVDEYVTWQWADVHTKEGKRTVTFPARHLPEASQTALMFTYISRTEGVIGVSAPFYILYYLGDPVSLSLLSDTSEKSSFVVLQKTPGSDFSSNGQSNNSASHDSNDQLAGAEGKSQHLETSTCQSEEVVTSHDDDQHLQVEMPLSMNNNENQESQTASCLSHAPSREEKEVFLSNDHVENRENKGQVSENSDHLKERHPLGLSGLTSSYEKLTNKLELTQEASENWKYAAEKYGQQIAILMKRIDQLEAKQASKVTRDDLSWKPDTEQKLAAVVKENDSLRQSVQSLEARLRESDITISKLKDQLRKDKSRRRDLEQALIRERLSYENTLKKLGAKESNPQLNSKHEEQGDDNTTEENVEQSSVEVMGSFIPASQRSASALVRLGLNNEPEAVTHVMIQPEVKSSASLRCPVCSLSASTFPDESAFSDHVNGHFPD